MGAFESGYFPGVVYLLSCWYSRCKWHQWWLSPKYSDTNMAQTTCTRDFRCSTQLVSSHKQLPTFLHMDLPTWTASRISKVGDGSLLSKAWSVGITPLITAHEGWPRNILTRKDHVGYRLSCICDACGFPRQSTSFMEISQWKRVRLCHPPGE